MHGGPDRPGLRRIERTHEIAPQRGLPTLIVRELATAALDVGDDVVRREPAVEPVRAKDLVLIEQRGETLGELQAPLEIAVGEEGRDRRVDRLMQTPRQFMHQPPHERVAIERGLRGDALATEHRAIHAPQEATRQLEAHRGAHAGRRGHRHLQPVGGRVALHEHHFLLERLERLAREPREDVVAQQFETIALQDDEAGGKCARHGDRDCTTVREDYARLGIRDAFASGCRMARWSLR